MAKMIDWTKCKKIDSGECLQDIEHHFRIFAGPGAGKTHWLINHVKNVLRKSKRLGRTGKIACITYTNMGVEEIQKRLKHSAERVEISTIHSFLYSNVIKPFAFLLKDDDGRYMINLKEMDGHIEHIPRPGAIHSWRKECVPYLKYGREVDRKIYECLIDLEWCFEDEEELVCLPKKRYKLNVGGKYRIRKDALKLYKQYYWNIGQIHHEDVLFFSYTLIKKYPNILEFIRAKFPYIFIDEFQDTNPIQTFIIKKIAEEYTIVGVIGDLAQSIYGFQGARRQDFKEFILENGIDYKIEDNRRSTENIISILNHMRGNDIRQKSINKKIGGPVIFIVGTIHDVIKTIKEQHDELAILARKNSQVGLIRYNGDNEIPDLWDELRSIDSNWDRTNFLYALFQGVALIGDQDYKEAFKGLEKNFRKNKDGKSLSKDMKRDIAVNCLQRAVNEWEKWKDHTIQEFNNYFVTCLDEEYSIKVGAAITRGSVRAFSESWKCKNFEQCLKVDDRNNIRTIHKAKGGQFKNVLVALENEDQLKFIIKPDIENDEDDECRLYYVALSRVMDNLFICAPTLSDENRDALVALNLEVWQIQY